MSDAILLEGARQRRADDVALVLGSEGIPARVVRRPDGFEVRVPAEELERALALVEVWREENRPEPAEPGRPDGDFPLAPTAMVVASLALFYAITGTRDAESVWFAEGSARASRILLGEVWRTVTALTLHSDGGHLLGNVLSGFLFLGFLGRRLGAGVAISVAVLAGAGGNLANAWLHQARHDSVGASTAVFACVGALAALAAAAPSKRARRPYLVAVGAGFALLAMLGTGGERTDLWAHFFGLVAGFAVGLPWAVLTRERPGTWVQLACGAGSAAVVIGCWALALQGA